MPHPAAKPFSGIFVSYRRDDSAPYAGRLSDKLVDHFGRDRIFMDIDTIEPGEDFVTVIENAVGSCEILIVVIGRQWLTSTGRNTGRLDNPNDFVRLEIATALSRDIRVIPVLVQRASMPKPQDLPDDLAKFARRNAVELSDNDWQNDVVQLIGVMQRVLDQQNEARRITAQEEEEERGQQEDETRKLEEALRCEAESRRGEEAAHQGQEKQPREEQEEGRSRQPVASGQALGSAESETTILKTPRAPEQRKSRHLYVALVVFMLVALLGGLYALSHIGRSKEVPKSDAGQNPTDDSSPASTSTTPSIENRNMNNADKPGQNSSSSSNGNTGNANKGNFNVRPSIPVQPNTGEAERQRQAIKKLDEAARQQRAIDALNDEKPVKKPTPG